MVTQRSRSRMLLATSAMALIAVVAAQPLQQPPPPQRPSTLPIPPQPPPAPPARILQNYRAVTADRLTHPEDGEWLMWRRTYDGWAYSPLDQITPANVKRLQPVWMMSTGMNNGQEAPPIVNGGVMFVSTSYNQVMAIDAKGGHVLWRYRSPTPTNARGKPVSRGVDLYGNKIFFALGEAILVALDARTGQEVWKTTIDDNTSGVYMTAAPLIAHGKVLVGVSGGDGPNRGYVSAYDPETGKEIWKTYTIPAPGEAGSETWSGEQWKTGGGATWVTTPNESWDWDEVSPPLLIDFKRGGRTIKGLVNFARSG